LDLLIYGISNIKYPLEDDLFDINMLDLNHTAPVRKNQEDAPKSSEQMKF
jgi:hypothetical protein